MHLTLFITVNHKILCEKWNSVPLIKKKSSRYQEEGEWKRKIKEMDIAESFWTKGGGWEWTLMTGHWCDPKVHKLLAAASKEESIDTSLYGSCWLSNKVLMFLFVINMQLSLTNAVTLMHKGLSLYNRQMPSYFWQPKNA